MKTDKIIYWISTGLLSIMMLLQSFMFIFNTEQIEQLFSKLNMPAFLIIPLGIAKLLGVIAILSKVNPMLKKFAYIGFFLDFIAALVSHLVAGDPDFTGAVMAIVFVSVSYIYDRKLYT